MKRYGGEGSVFTQTPPYPAAPERTSTSAKKAVQASRSRSDVRGGEGFRNMAESSEIKFLPKRNTQLGLKGNFENGVFQKNRQDRSGKHPDSTRRRTNYQTSGFQPTQHKPGTIIGIIIIFAQKMSQNTAFSRFAQQQFQHYHHHGPSLRRGLIHHGF